MRGRGRTTSCPSIETFSGAAVVSADAVVEVVGDEVGVAAASPWEDFKRGNAKGRAATAGMLDDRYGEMTNSS